MSVTTEALQAEVEVALFLQAKISATGYTTGIRPNHKMVGRNDMFLGSLEFADREWLRLGEKCRATGQFLVLAKDVVNFVPGFSWQICEAEKVVGECKLIKILPKGNLS